MEGSRGYTRTVTVTLCTVLGCLLMVSGLVGGFNIDTKSAVVHRGTPGSMFGFSVALFKDRRSSWSKTGKQSPKGEMPGEGQGCRAIEEERVRISYINVALLSDTRAIGDWRHNFEPRSSDEDVT
ncbi:uncharacterized protein TNCV_2615661 [Trichonephila clavipes]|nr:uncharacterized protein TNCV_2615661 [Trichonephila clavipes]